MSQHATVVIKAFLSASLLLRNRRRQRGIRGNKQTGEFPREDCQGGFMESWPHLPNGYSSLSSESTVPGKPHRRFLGFLQYIYIENGLQYMDD